MHYIKVTCRRYYKPRAGDVYRRCSQQAYGEACQSGTHAHLSVGTGHSVNLPRLDLGSE